MRATAEDRADHAQWRPRHTPLCVTPLTGKCLAAIVAFLQTIQQISPEDQFNKKRPAAK